MSHSAAEGAAAMLEVMANFGTPIIFQSDQGTEFKNELVKKLAELWGMEHRFITVGNSKGNGIIEIQVKNTLDIIKKLSLGKDNWDEDENIARAQTILNSKVSKLGLTPFEIMFGRKNNFFNIKEVNDRNEKLDKNREEWGKVQHVESLKKWNERFKFLKEFRNEEMNKWNIKMENDVKKKAKLFDVDQTVMCVDRRKWLNKMLPKK